MSQTNHGILLHVIFSTKFRKPLLDDSWRNDLLAYMGGTAKEHKAVILKAGGVEDHVHLLLRIHPSFSVSGTVRMLKANSSKWINEGGKNPKEVRMAAWLRCFFGQPVDGGYGKSLH